MESSKQWPYWARGATIAAVVCLAGIFFQTVLIPKFFYTTCGDGFCMTGFAASIRSIFNFTLIPLWSSPVGPFFLEHQTIFYFVACVYYFFIGAFLGLMYGKIKHGKDHV